MQAVWNGQVIAESDDTVVVENNHYFPTSSMKDGVMMAESATHTVCPWKGTASYYSVQVDGQTNPDAAWYYPEPKPKAEMVRDRVAFWHGITVQPAA